MQRREAGVNVALAAEERVERGVILLGPCVDADMGFRQYRDAGDAAARGEAMDVHMEDGRARGIGGLPERPLGVVHVVERPSPPEIKQHMHAAGADIAVGQ